VGLPVPQAQHRQFLVLLGRKATKAIRERRVHLVQLGLPVRMAKTVSMARRAQQVQPVLPVLPARKVILDRKVQPEQLDRKATRETLAQRGRTEPLAHKGFKESRVSKACRATKVRHSTLKAP
jgi:hypothetical protein